MSFYCLYNREYISDIRSCGTYATCDCQEVCHDPKKENKADFLKRVKAWDAMMTEKDRQELLRLAHLGAQTEADPDSDEAFLATFKERFDFVSKHVVDRVSLTCHLITNSRGTILLSDVKRLLEIALKKQQS